MREKGEGEKKWNKTKRKQREKKRNEKKEKKKRKENVKEWSLINNFEYLNTFFFLKELAECLRQNSPTILASAYVLSSLKSSFNISLQFAF